MTGSGTPVADDARLHDEALDWVVHLTSGTATHADGEALLRWRRQSDTHEQAFRRVVRLNACLRQAAIEIADERQRAPAEFRPNTAILTGRRAVVGGAIAASVAAYYMMTRPPLGLWPSLQELQADYRTGTGEQHNMTLAQGVSVDLNTQTSISIPTGHLRPRIDLITGEAIITAKRDPATPVIVAAAGGQASSSEAEFDIRCDGSAVRVTCLAGEVRVGHAGQEVVLQAGQQTRFGDRPLQTAKDVDPTLLTAWRSGLLIFHDEPLSRVISELNRYRRGHIILTSARLGRIPMNGVFHLDRLDGVIEQIKALGASVTDLPGGVVLVG